MRTALALMGLLLSVVSCRGLAGGTASGPTGSDLGVRDGSTNVIERRYAKAMDATWTAVVAAAEESGLKVENAASDAFGGWLNASRADGSKIGIEVKSINKDLTSVAVHRAAYTCQPDRSMPGCGCQLFELIQSGSP